MDSIHVKEDLCKFLIEPLLRAMDAEEPLESLEEMRQLVVMHLNVVMETVTMENVPVVNDYFKIVCK